MIGVACMCTHQLCSLYFQSALTFMVRPEALIAIPEVVETRDDVGIFSPLSLILHKMHTKLTVIHKII